MAEIGMTLGNTKWVAVATQNGMPFTY